MESTKLISTAIDILKNAIKEMPKTPGVYKMLDSSGKVLYVGKAKMLPKRVYNYTNISKLPNRLRRMVSQIHEVHTITTKTEGEALLLEANLIKTLKPVYNISLRDDKTFPYIQIVNNHQFPRITKYRGKKDTQNSSYYGPFANAGAVNQTIAELQKIFQIRPCSDNYFNSRKRPCLQFEIKRCSAPCVGKINEADYKQLILQAKAFLSGKNQHVQEVLAKQMQEFSAQMQFEKAAQIRDRLKLINIIQAKNTFSNTQVEDADIFAFYVDENLNSCLTVFFIRGGRNYGNKNYFNQLNSSESHNDIFTSLMCQFYQFNPPPLQILISHELENPKEIATGIGNIFNLKTTIVHPKKGYKKDLLDFCLENAKLALIKENKERIKNESMLQAVGKLFDINNAIKRIELYDNSHISGTNAVGCMVVVDKSGFNKKEYRKFNIKSARGDDDFGMMREVIERRMKRLSEDNKPDLMIIDGGIGQLNAVLEVMDRFPNNQITVVAMAKGEDRNAGREHFISADRPPFQLPKGDPLLNYLHSIRDEVHRYAIETHRSKREKTLRHSQLDDIPGIGSYRKRQLLSSFGSIEAIKSASIIELTRINGISKATAKIIFDHFNRT